MELEYRKVVALSLESLGSTSNDTGVVPHVFASSRPRRIERIPSIERVRISLFTFTVAFCDNPPFVMTDSVRIGFTTVDHVDRSTGAWQEKTLFGVKTCNGPCPSDTSIVAVNNIA